MSKKIVGNYQKVQINTASPGQRVVMVYDTIRKNLESAMEAFKDDSPDKFAKINNGIQMAEKLILELQLALDKEKGGEIAENLNSLYSFWTRHLSDANIMKNRDMLANVHKMVVELMDGWVQAEKKTRNM